MDIAELAAKLAEKSNKPGGAAESAASRGAHTESKSAPGRQAKQRPAEKRPSIAKKAAAGRWSVPRTSGK